LVSVLPFDVLVSFNMELTELSTISKLGKFQKLTKLGRMVRLIKLVKQSSKIFRYIQEYFHIKPGFERLVAFILSVILMFHILGCLWIILPLVNADVEETWMSEYSTQEDYELYITSIYFIVMTITTVGYGDIPVTNTLERVFCIFLMVIGVIAFSFATGSLASILQNYDIQNAKLSEKMIILNKLRKEYFLPLELYSRLKKSMSRSMNQDSDEMNNFLEILPNNLRIEVSLYLHEETYKHLNFL